MRHVILEGASWASQGFDAGSEARYFLEHVGC
jgi:hypothetical protein